MGHAAVLPKQVRDVTAELVHDVVLGRFEKIATDNRIGRLTSADLRRAIAEYGRTLVDLPEEGWSLLDVQYIDDAHLALDVPMWTAEEGRSDLTLSLSVELGPTKVHVSIDDLHVL